MGTSAPLPLPPHWSGRGYPQCSQGKAPVLFKCHRGFHLDRLESKAARWLAGLVKRRGADLYARRSHLTAELPCQFSGLLQFLERAAFSTSLSSSIAAT
jgi:hypothetical protein